ncbi:alpha/beta fold hydrolase [Chryseobacterium jejuense]|uniref:alpha/beta fold hydrolase n=1 Tax=Chryseobacterium jejuense TaxID=445960 RepID=UPI003D0994A7
MIHLGHSTGGGEVIRYVAKHENGRISKAVLVSAVTPIIVQNKNNPNGVPISVFDDIRNNTANHRQQFFIDLTFPFYNYNREEAKISEGIQKNWRRQRMNSSIKVHYDYVKAFSETDFTEYLKSVDIPVLVMHGEDDQIVPFETTGKVVPALLKNGKLIPYSEFPHGIPTTEAETINKNLLTFFTL